jgi:NAD(P)-dependent dehydrogenase (short-subunit alcohol dehydrogenase family)
MAASEPIAFVTGASSGIGRATARLFVERGYRVFGTSRQARPDEAGVEMLELDVCSDESVARGVAEALARAGRIDVLVNNAGIDLLGLAEETPMDGARALFETNFFGVVRVTNAVLPHMRARREGRIIHVGSVSAWVGEPGESFYGASKRALAGYAEALRHEVWPFGIHVSLVEPGSFKTDIIPAEPSTDGPITDYAAVRRAAMRTLYESLRRGGDPRRVAEVILTVARARSPRLRYGVGSEAFWIPPLKVLLPQRLFDALVRRGFGLRKDGAR